MLVGRCKECDVYYTGWALENSENRKCNECGGEIEIIEKNIDSDFNEDDCCSPTIQ